MLFKSWEKIVAEHDGLIEMMEELRKISDESVKEHNSKRAPLMIEEKRLRDELVRSTERERKSIEEKIDRIVDELKPLNEMIDGLHRKKTELRNKIYTYMRKNMTSKELKKARSHGWEV